MQRIIVLSTDQTMAVPNRDRTRWSSHKRLWRSASAARFLRRALFHLASPMFSTLWAIVLCATGAHAQLRSSDMHPSGKMTTAVFERITRGKGPDEPLELIVELADPDSVALGLGTDRVLSADEIAAVRTQRAATKRAFLNRSRQVTVVQDFSHLPLMFVRIPSEAALETILSDAQVRAIFDNELLTYPTLNDTLPLIRRPELARGTPFDGEGTAIAILDTGVDFTQPEFGTCTASGNGWQPQSSRNCRVIRSLDFADNDGVADDNNHGTNVAAIAASVAPGASIIMLDVFSGQDTNGDGVNDQWSSMPVAQTAALNWIIANASTFNIVAANMSLGSIQDLDGDNAGGQVGDVDNDGVGDIGYVAATCPATMATPFANARAAGVTVVNAAGNDGLASTIAYPACDASAFPVGATYAEDLGAADVRRNVLITSLGGGLDAQGLPRNGFDVGVCTIANPQNQAVTCFSNSSGQVDLVAPGVGVSAGGFTMTGTSMSAPHVAGIAALAGQAGGNLTAAEIIQDLLATRRTRNDPKFGRMAFADAVASVLAASPWTPITERLEGADWYQEVPESLTLSVIGLAYSLYGVSTTGSRAPLVSRLIAPLVISVL